MLRRPLTVLTVITFICALLSASAAGAQESTAGETTARANDAANAGVEATTSNVSAQTGNVGVAVGRGAADNQYRSERTVEDTVIKETIPNKGKLAGTGGMPLAGVALLSLAIVGLGVSILRSAIRRGS